MRRLLSVFTFLGVLFCAGVASAQPWAGIITPARAIDWSLAGVPGGIPTTWANCTTTNCNTVNAGTVNSASVNAAIATAPAQSVVRIPVGNFTMTAGINWSRSNVILRGAGPLSTTLTFTGPSSLCGLAADICIQGTTQSAVGGALSYNPLAASIKGWTAGFAKGTTCLTLQNVTGIDIGTVLFLDQIDDAADTGSIFVIQTPTFQQGGVDQTGRNGNRALNQIVKVTTINSGACTSPNVVISPGLYSSHWLVGRTPQVWIVGTSTQIAANNGVESMTLNHSAVVADGVRFDISYGNWMKNVRSINPRRNHVWSRQSAHDEVRDSYFYATQGAASQSYGIETFSGNDILVINNIFQHVTTPLLWGNDAGNVGAYNFMIDNYQTIAPGFMFFSLQVDHHPGGSMILLEGNVCNAAVPGDLAHGTSNQTTLFRNRLSGLDPSSGSTTDTIPIVAKSYQRYNIYIGNVLGTTGYHNRYEDSDGPQGVKGDPNHSVYWLGFTSDPTPENYAPGLPFDPFSLCPSSSAACTMMRWMNWDSATGTRSFANEVPTSADFSISVPASTSLPPSFFLPASQPSWWSMAPTLGVATPPWPPIGPDVNGGNIANAGGHAYKIPAQLCWENVGDDPAFPNPDPSGLRIKKFDATSCYSTGSGGVFPSAPTGFHFNP